MAYQKQTWINLPDRTTPISADRLNHMEDGIEAIDTELENIDTHLTDYVKNTDYASSSKGGVIKVQDTLGLGIGNTGNLFATTKIYSTYQTLADGLVISKGTLENVITGKGLVSNTDYATNNTGGVVKIDAYAITKNTNGNLMSNIYNYSTYSTASDNSFISKGTLENVLNEKIGDIQTLLDNLDVGSGVNGN